MQCFCYVECALIYWLDASIQLCMFLWVGSILHCLLACKNLFRVYSRRFCNTFNQKIIHWRRQRKQQQQFGGGGLVDRPCVHHPKNSTAQQLARQATEIHVKFTRVPPTIKIYTKYFRQIITLLSSAFGKKNVCNFGRSRRTGANRFFFHRSRRSSPATSVSCCV